VYLLIPAAGTGRRMGSSRNKLLLVLGSRPIIAWTLLAAEASEYIQWIGIVSQPHDWDDFKTILQELNLTKPVVIPDKNQFIMACRGCQKTLNKF
jgi:2-C-methyl-D-erythritol 4-phosphate cytidylyltransferase